MSIWAHLQELRTRLARALVGIGVCSIVGWYLYEPVMSFITSPLTQLHGPQINFQTIGAAFDLKLKVAVWIGTFLACPWWIYQIGAFIAPGLRKREKLYILVFGVAGVILFLAGALSGIWVAPKAVHVLQSFVPAEGVSLLSAAQYVSFYTRLVLIFGLSFLLPEILVLLGFLNVVTAKSLLKAWRWVTLFAFIFAAIANPLPSPWPMTLQALVLVSLYLLAVLIVWIREKMIARKHRPRANYESKTKNGAVPSK
ncbi:MAG: twin-arginine translocase subunit TatC [Actinomycetaceae bacterium]|nr:twin-arginine translocase subunit TatC [Actinomycetaceae bacterium]